MKKKYAIIFILLFTVNTMLLAQNGAVSTGTTLTAGNRKISYSIGQAFYNVHQSTAGIVREGLQQPYNPVNALFSHVIPTYLGTSGASVTALNRKLSYTVGQPFYTLKSGSTGKIRDGIQQPLLSPVMLNLHLYIEGFYLGGGMLAEVLGNGICDSIQVELHDPMSPSSIIYSATSLLSVYGNAKLNIPPAFRGNYYYVVIRHRNSIETWSKFPIHMTAFSTFNLKTN